MEVISVALDLPANNYSGFRCINLAKGQLLSATVARIKGEMVLLLLNSRIPLQSRVISEMELEEGQKLWLVVKEAEESKVVLGIVKESRLYHKDLRGLLNQIGIDAIDTNCEIVKLIMKNGLPVTKENIDFVLGTMKSLKYIVGNFNKLAKLSFPEEVDLTRVPVEDIARWMLEQCRGSVTNPISKVQIEKLFLFKEELEQISFADIVRLLKLGVKPTPFNLELIRKVEEYKGFFKSLLKIVLKYAGEEAGDTVKTYRNVGVGESFGAKTGRNIKPIKISDLLGKIMGSNKPDTRFEAAVQTLLEKAFVLNNVLKDGSCFLVPFLFNREIQEAIIIIDQDEKGESGQSGDVLGCQIITETRFLGKLEVAIRKENRNISCRVFAQADEVVSLLEGEKKYLADLLYEQGYRLLEFGCYRVQEKNYAGKEKFFDVRV